MAEVKNLEKIEIVPNEEGGIKLFVNGERVDLKDTIGIHLDVRYDTENTGGVVFELTTKKRICMLTDYDYADKK